MSRRRLVVYSILIALFLAVDISLIRYDIMAERQRVEAQKAQVVMAAAMPHVEMGHPIFYSDLSPGSYTVLNADIIGQTGLAMIRRNVPTGDIPYFVSDLPEAHVVGTIFTKT